jgi:V8-like Glu-specific endopeptidase
MALQERAELFLFKKKTLKLGTLPGHSGSPVFIEENIIAIHIGGGMKNE